MSVLSLSLIVTSICRPRKLFTTSSGGYGGIVEYIYYIPLKIFNNLGPDKRRDQRGRLQRLCPAAGRHHAEECAGNPQPRRHSLRQGVHRTRDAGVIMTMLLSSFMSSVFFANNLCIPWHLWSCIFTVTKRWPELYLM